MVGKNEIELPSLKMGQNFKSNISKDHLECISPSKLTTILHILEERIALMQYLEVFTYDTGMS